MMAAPFILSILSSALLHSQLSLSCVKIPVAPLFPIFIAVVHNCRLDKADEIFKYMGSLFWRGGSQ